MCGIVGIAGNMISKHNDIFRDMLFFDTVRGVDSTGVLRVPLGPDATPSVVRTLGHPLGLAVADSVAFTPKGKVQNIHKVLLGHNRAATQGSVTLSNAHPIQVGDIIGVHNGTLWDHKDLCDDKEEDLDSRAIYRSIESRGIDETWKNLSGPAALVWWNNKDKTLNLLRNNERPLWVGWGSKRDVIYWASESWMIKSALLRNNETLNVFTEGEDKGKLELFELKEHFLHTFTPTSTSCPLTEVRELEKKPIRPTITTNAWQRNYGPTGHRGSGHFKSIHPRNRFASSVSKKQFTFNWADDTERGDKTLRGTLFRITGYISFIAGHERYGQNHFVGFTLEEPKIRVEVYPATPFEEQVFLQEYKKQVNFICAFASRPRIYEDEIFDTIFRIGSAGVSMNVKPPVEGDEQKDNVIQLPDQSKRSIPKMLFLRGTLVEAARFREHLMEHTRDGCCSACGNPINEDDSRDVEWLSKSGCLCPHCKNDPDVRQILKEAIA